MESGVGAVRKVAKEGNVRMVGDGMGVCEGWDGPIRAG